MKWKWFVHIIECNDGSYYTGRTWNPNIRYEQHLTKFGSRYTAEHGIKRLAYLEEHENFETATMREKQIKGWTREKKESS